MFGQTINHRRPSVRTRDVATLDAMSETDRDPQTLTVLTTEHFALQGGRSSTVSESSARAALYVGSVSSGLVALGFVGRGDDPDTFNGFALVVLPTLFVLGVFTFARLVQNSIEDMFLGRAINRIRQYYVTVLGDDAQYVMLNADDDPLGVLRNAGIVSPSRWQLYFTLAMMIAVVNSVIGGTTVTLILSLWDVPVGGSASAGVAAGALAVLGLHRWQRGMHDAARERVAPMSPSTASELS